MWAIRKLVTKKIKLLFIQKLQFVFKLLYS